MSARTAHGQCTVAVLACGWRHSAAIASDGGLFMWGYGKDGQLGLGTPCRRCCSWRQPRFRQLTYGEAVRTQVTAPAAPCRRGCHICQQRAMLHAATRIQSVWAGMVQCTHGAKGGEGSSAKVRRAPCAACVLPVGVLLGGRLVAADGSHRLSVRSDGTPGEASTSTAKSTPTVVRLPGGAGAATAAACGWMHSAVLTDAGQVRRGCT